jgi:hypothetical protein
MRCIQCGRPAYAIVNEHPLCVDHFNMVQQAEAQWWVGYATLTNHLRASMDPSGRVLPPIPVPRPVIQAGPTIFNNIKVDRSVVGSINTGQIQRLDVAIDHVKQSGDEQVAAALASLTQAVVDSADLNRRDRDSTLEQLAYLAEQATLPAERRANAVARSVVAGLERVLSVAADLATVWAGVQPILQRIFP